MKCLPDDMLSPCLCCLRSEICLLCVMQVSHQVMVGLDIKGWFNVSVHWLPAHMPGLDHFLYMGTRYSLGFNKIANMTQTKSFWSFNQFPCVKIIVFLVNVTGMWSWGSNLQLVSIGSDNGFMLNSKLLSEPMMALSTDASFSLVEIMCL